MKIKTIEIRACRTQLRGTDSSQWRHGSVRKLDFLVVSMTTESGARASTFGFASTSAPAAARLAADILKPFFLGKDALERERHWHDYRMADRWWHHLPIYSYGPFDICCWLLAAEAAEQPLYRYLGAYRDSVPIYASSLVLPEPAAYAAEAKRAQSDGWAAYKLHPPGTEEFDLEAYRLCREAVGPNFKLMADPVAAYRCEQALRIGRKLEELGFYWLEEPLYDTDIASLQKLSGDLDIPICGTEVIVGSHYATAQCIAQKAVDIVRTDVSWKGGVTAVMKTAHLAEAFGMNCEIHTAIFHPLELVNLHCCAAMRNCEFFEVLYPLDTFGFGLEEPIAIEAGRARLPARPGLGIELDWDVIENSTLEVF